MKINVRFRSLQPSDALKAYAERRVHFNLGRFGPQIALATVRLTDTNGPKGGNDCQCQIVVVGPRLGTHSLLQMHADPYAAVDLGLERMGRTIGRALERQRAMNARGLRGAIRAARPEEEPRAESPRSRE